MSSVSPMAMSERKIIARRAAMELKANSVVNLGIGMPEGVASVAAEEKIIDLITLTAEPGVIGGVPARGLISAQHERAGDHRPALSVRFLRRRRSRCRLSRPRAGRSEVTSTSAAWQAASGAGGFINISQNAKEVVFTGTFIAGEMRVALERRALRSPKTATSANSWRSRTCHLQRGSHARQRATAGALHHRAMRVPARRGGARTH